MVDIIINLSIPIILILLGLIIGKATERRHFRNLDNRENKLSHILVTDIKTFPGKVDNAYPPILLLGQTVIATDYLKSTLAKIKKIFGGEIKSYESLLIRARREALLQLLEQADQKGYNGICNVRLDTADIGGTLQGKSGTTTAGIMATGTAYRLFQDLEK